MASVARTQIIEITVKEILNGGVAGCALNQIIKRSALSKGAFYHYFPSKDDLLGAVIEEFLAREMNRIWLKPLARSGAGKAELGRILQYELQKCTESDGVSALLYILVQGYHLLGKANEAKLLMVQDSWAKRLERVFRQAARAGELKTSGFERSASWIILGMVGSAVALSRQSEGVSEKRELLRNWMSVFDAL